MLAQVGIAGNSMQNVHIGRDNLSTMAGDQAR